jgi:exodeoxyribonuclease-1
MKTYLWYDYETFGTDTKRDRISQFAGIRTDKDFNILDKIEYFCKLSEDYIPNYEACLVTGISPQDANKKGISEEKLANEIYREFNKEGTISTGYNSLKFDDEITRNLFYRTLRDPYTREWKNNCSRWDLLKALLAFYHQDRKSINWPISKERISFKLEELTIANNITHTTAHDALSDVEATISIAKLLKNSNSELYNYVLELRNKNNVFELIKKNQIFVHCDFSYSGENDYCSVLYKVNIAKRNANEFIFLDLKSDLDIFENLDIDELKSLLYMKKEELDSLNKSRPGIKIIKANQIPLLFTWDEFNNKSKFDSEYLKEQAKLAKEIEMKSGYKLTKILDNENKEENIDVELDIYSGFPSPNDKNQFILIHKDPKNYRPNFENKKYNELYFRWKAKNYFELLKEEEKEKWKKYCADVLFNKIPRDGYLTFEQFEKDIVDAKNKFSDNEKSLDILIKVEKYVQKLKKDLEKNNKKEIIKNLTLF